MCDYIKNERRRVGGDWVVAGWLFNKWERDEVRKHLGPGLQMISLNASGDLATIMKKEFANHETVEGMEKDKFVEEVVQYAKMYKIDDDEDVSQVDFDVKESKEHVLDLVFKKIDNPEPAASKSKVCQIL